MQTEIYELGDKVRITNKSLQFYGKTGVVSSILLAKEKDNIGVDVDGDSYDPTPHYYNEEDLEKL